MSRFFSMRVSSGWGRFALLVFGLMIVATRIEAQGVGYFIQAPNPIAVNNNITYTIVVTNLTGGPQAVTVTNTFSGISFQIGGTPTTSQGTASVGSTNVVFSLGLMANNAIAQMGVTVLPTSIGPLTNSLSVATNGVFLGTAPPFVVQVTNPAPVADLAVAMTGPSALVYSNDWMVYGINVTNLGPSDAPNVILTNSLPSGVGIISATPSNPSYSVQGTNVIFNLGTLTNQAFINFQLTVQPATVGALVFAAMVSTNSVNDPNLANNSASITVAVSNFLAGQFTVVTNSPQTTNYQNGFIEQNISLTNSGTNAVAAARVVVSGLKNNRLFNAVGTNNGSAFVVYANVLDTNQSVTLLLQYSVPNRSAFPFTNSQLQAFAVNVPDLTPPPVTLTSTNVNISRILERADGSILIEWPSITNRTYTVVYSDNVLFSNAMMAPPSIVAPANRTQWIDYGPPTTVSHPTNAPVRFYRIFLNP
ncbi:MAG: DUF11 domain-containing protein [Verrucomicrobiia bacterium]